MYKQGEKREGRPEHLTPMGAFIRPPCPLDRKVMSHRIQQGLGSAY